MPSKMSHSVAQPDQHFCALRVVLKQIVLVKLSDYLNVSSSPEEANRPDRSGLILRYPPPQQPAIFFNERFMAASHEEGRML